MIWILPIYGKSFGMVDNIDCIQMMFLWWGWWAQQKDAGSRVNSSASADVFPMSWLWWFHGDFMGIYIYIYVSISLSLSLSISISPSIHLSIHPSIHLSICIYIYIYIYICMPTGNAGLSLVAEQLFAGSLAPFGRAAGYSLRWRTGGCAARYSADDRGQDAMYGKLS